MKHQVNPALRHHARKESLKWVCPLLWSGGDAHVRLPYVGVESSQHFVVVRDQVNFFENLQTPFFVNRTIAHQNERSVSRPVPSQ